MPGPFDGLAAVFTAALGESITLRVTGQSDRTITGIPVRRSIEDLGIAQNAPMFHAADADVSTLQDGDQAIMRGVTYTVRARRPDGKGMTAVVLEG